MKGSFGEFGLSLESFVVQNVSLPEELQKRLDERIGMGVGGEMGRCTQFPTAQATPIAAGAEAPPAPSATPSSPSPPSSAPSAERCWVARRMSGWVDGKRVVVLVLSPFRPLG